MNRKPLIRQENPCWYTVWCKPRQEQVAEVNLRRQGLQVYLPRICTKQRRRGQWVDIVEALFPRYLFIRVDPLRNSTAPVRSTRGVVGLVHFGREPAAVPDAVIDSLRQREDGATGLRQDDRPLFCVGDSVSLVDGPLAGMQGIFEREEGGKRVSLLLELLGEANKVKVSRDSITRVA